MKLVKIVFMIQILFLCLTTLVSAQTILTVTEGTPTLDGSISASEWPSEQLTTKNGITIQAMADGSNLYLVATWQDDTENIDKKLWKFDGSSWSQSGDEDRISFVWDMGLNGSDGAGCLTMCHGDGLMRTNNGKVVPGIGKQPGGMPWAT